MWLIYLADRERKLQENEALSPTKGVQRKGKKVVDSTEIKGMEKELFTFSIKGQDFKRKQTRTSRSRPIKAVQDTKMGDAQDLLAMIVAEPS